MSDLTGSMGFLDVGNQTSDVSWLCVITHSQQVVPELKVERFVKGKLDAKVKLTFIENGQGGATAVGAKGEVTLVPKNPPTTSGGRFVWSLTLSARAGGPDVTYLLSGKENAQASFEVLTRFVATSLQRPELNTGAPVNLQLTEAPVPRFSLGINLSVPRDPGPEYKITPPPPAAPGPPAPPITLRPGPGSVADAVNGSAPGILALLYRLFVILDRPGTLDPLWDQQSLTSTADSLSPARFQTEKIRIAEEMWARQVTEMLAFTPYGGPAVQYGQGCSDLELIALGIAPGASNPRYGIYFGCQHLANFGVLSRGLQTLATSPVFPNGILLEANAGCVDAVMGMVDTASKLKGVWLDATNPPTVRAAAPGGDPGLLADGTGTANLTPTITGSFPAQGATFKYQPGSVHLFSNRPARANNPAAYKQAADDLANGIEPTGPGPICTIVTVAKGNAVTKVPKPKKGDPPDTTTIPGAQTGLRELCFVKDAKTGKFKHEAADLIVSQSNPALLFAGHNVAAPVPPHLGFSLRTRKTRVQFFDTGGFSIAAKAGGVNRSPGVTAVPDTQQFHGGNFDDPLGDEIHGAHPFRGTGIFAPMSDAAAQLLHDQVINVLRKARPLGLAKLVVFQRDPPFEAKPLLPRVAYSSPVLNMWHGSSTESNYAISRYMWSLRNMPGATDMGVVWLIWNPQRDLAAAMRDATRTASAVSIAARLSNLPPGATQDRRLHDFIFQRLNPAAQVSLQPDGTVKVFVAGKGAPHPTLALVERFLRLDRATQVVPNQPSYFNA